VLDPAHLLKFSTTLKAVFFCQLSTKQSTSNFFITSKSTEETEKKKNFKLALLTKQ